MAATGEVVAIVSRDVRPLNEIALMLGVDASKIRSAIALGTVHVQGETREGREHRGARPTKLVSYKECAGAIEHKDRRVTLADGARRVNRTVDGIRTAIVKGQLEDAGGKGKEKRVWLSKLVEWDMTHIWRPGQRRKQPRTRRAMQAQVKRKAPPPPLTKAAAAPVPEWAVRIMRIMVEANVPAFSYDSATSEMKYTQVQTETRTLKV